MPSKLSHVTIDHDEIRRWAESRGGKPAAVRRTRNGSTGIIRIDFPGFRGAKSLQPISWDEWFESFDENNLALVYQDKTARGQRSSFNKLVGRESVDLATQNSKARPARRARRASGTSQGRKASAGGRRTAAKGRTRAQTGRTASAGRSQRGGASERTGRRTVQRASAAAKTARSKTTSTRGGGAGKRRGTSRTSQRSGGRGARRSR